MRLANKVAIVTGAASGFGKGIAELFAREGARVAVLDINAQGAKEVAEGIGKSAIAVTCEVRKSADIGAAVKATQAAFATVDILINNAGWTHVRKSLLDVEEAEFDRMLAINVKSIFHFAKAIVPVFRQRRGGVMINIGSTAGIR